MENKVIHIGRTPQNQVVIPETGVSKLHAQITQVSDNVYLLEDKDSTNGTYVNGLGIKRMIVTRQDQITIGSKQLDIRTCFQPEAEPVANAAAAASQPKTVFTIGRAAGNDIVIAENTVSARHATVKIIDAASFELTDLQSSNGTFVNGVRIQGTKLVTPKDTVRLGNTYLFAIDKHIGMEKYQAPAKNAALTEQEQIREAFRQLKPVYEQYISTKLKIQKNAHIKSQAIRGGLALIPFVGNAVGIWATASLSPGEKLVALDEEFKVHYVCPKCHNFLGFVPWEGLAKKKTCSYCKTKWVL